MDTVSLQTIAQALEIAGRSFQPDELAYLALTSKIERPIQDRLAFALYKMLGSRVAVSREWQRVDIAVVDPVKNVPKMMLEAKAMYSFDLGKSSGERHIREMWDDAAKVTKLNPMADTYLLALIAHPWSTPDYMRGVVKYLDQIRAFYGGGSMEDQYGDFWYQSADILLEGLKPLSDGVEWLPDVEGNLDHAVGARLLQGAIHGGIAFGARVSVFWVLSGPVTRHEARAFRSSEAMTL